MKRLLIVSLLLTASPPVLAQQQPVAADRVAAQIGQLYIQTQQQQDMIANLQSQLAKAQADVKQLRDKYEPETKKD